MQSCSTSPQYSFLHANFQNLHVELPLLPAINACETSFTPCINEGENASEIKYHISFVASIEEPMVNCQTVRYYANCTLLSFLLVYHSGRFINLEHSRR